VLGYTARFAGGCFGSIDNSRRAVYGYDERVELFGSEGTVSTENNTPTRTRLATADAVQEALPLHFLMERYMESYILEMKSFIECVAVGREPPVGGLDGRAPAVMGKAAKCLWSNTGPCVSRRLADSLRLCAPAACTAVCGFVSVAPSPYTSFPLLTLSPF
jgi:myo-inositol 2-dehydrogenase/D-chiro-inositol 1-dehydrogenase